MSENINDPIVPDDSELAAELAGMLYQTETEIDIEKLRKIRARALRTLKQMQKGTRMGALVSLGSAILDVRDERGWQALCHSRGRKLYAELRTWALLYQCDLMIMYIKEGGKFPASAAVVQSTIYQGMAFANGDWVHEQMGEEPPSERGKML